MRWLLCQWTLSTISYFSFFVELPFCSRSNGIGRAWTGMMLPEQFDTEDRKSRFERMDVRSLNDYMWNSLSFHASTSTYLRIVFVGLRCSWFHTTECTLRSIGGSIHLSMFGPQFWIQFRSADLLIVSMPIDCRDFSLTTSARENSHRIMNGQDSHQCFHFPLLMIQIMIANPKVRVKSTTNIKKIL